jgi:glyoxylase-like metal-dependent hydrolase (beta-lactamase superfamily II)
MPKLNWTLLTKKRAGVTQGLPPGKEDLAWVTNTVTLIYGERDAVLVDTFLSIQHSKELVDWLVQSGNLTSIYITHAHGDHFLGLKIVQDSFPNAKAFATPSTVAAMQNRRFASKDKRCPHFDQLRSHQAPHQYSLAFRPHGRQRVVALRRRSDPRSREYEKAPFHNDSSGGLELHLSTRACGSNSRRRLQG